MPEPAVPEDRAGPDDRDVEPAADRVVAQQLGLQLGPAVRLERPARRRLRRPGCAPGSRTPRSTTCARPWRPRHRARRRARWRCRRRSPRRTARGPWPAAPARRCAARRRRRRTRRAPPSRSRTSPATNSAAGVGSGRVEVEDAHVVALRERARREHGAEVAAAAGDEHRARHQSGQPRARHHRTLAAHAFEQRDRRARSRAPCAPGRCRTRSCPSARRARAPPARTGRPPAAAPSTLLRDDAGDPRDRAAAARSRRRAPRPRARRARSARMSRSSYGSASAIQYACPARRGRDFGEQRALHEVAGVHHRPPLGARRRRAGSGRGAPPRRTASAAPVGTARRTTAGGR